MPTCVNMWMYTLRHMCGVLICLLNKQEWGRIHSLLWSSPLHFAVCPGGACPNVNILNNLFSSCLAALHWGGTLYSIIPLLLDTEAAPSAFILPPAVQWSFGCMYTLFLHMYHLISKVAIFWIKECAFVTCVYSKNKAKTQKVRVLNEI